MDAPIFPDRLEQFEDRLALTTADGKHIGYRELAVLADTFATRLRPAGGVLLLELAHHPVAVAAYLGALRARVPVIVVEPGACAASPWLIETFAPEHICRFSDGTPVLETTDPGTSRREPPHPELAVLLSTSGSTGSPKLVKLSLQNICANAASIAEFLAIDADRVAISNLPLHYSYGLSVLNSFLSRGARVVLTDLSVVDACFGELFRREGVTDLAGVPYTYELLERSGFRRGPPPTLRVMTQAGGRLPADMVSTYAGFARAHGLRFFVMYGQTEATARMAYLPPEEAEANPECVGIAIPGGQFSVLDHAGIPVESPGIPGELVYRGPNVMMGYARSRAELVDGAVLDGLRTGDIAQFESNGLLRIVGRTSRFCKIAGLRIGFDDVERIVRDAGGAGFASGTDEYIAIALVTGDAESVTRAVAARTGLPQRLFMVLPMAAAPVLSSGKIDYEAIRRAGRAAFEARAAGADASGRRSVAAVVSDALSLPDVDTSLSFIELGGDSLSYLTVSMGLEEIIGRLPEGWESMPLVSLERLAEPGREIKPVARVGTDLLLRLLAITLIFMGHSTFPPIANWLKGGSGILLMLAGMSLARYQMPLFLDGRGAIVLRATFMRIVLPYFVVMTLVLLGSGAKKSLAWHTLSSVFFLTPAERNPMVSYWFVETLIHAILATWLLTRIPFIRRLVSTRPFESALLLANLAAVVCVAGELGWHSGEGITRTLDSWLYYFFSGWALHHARSWRESMLVGLLVFSVAAVQFGLLGNSRAWLAFAAVATMVALPEISVSRDAASVIRTLAGATFFMYLMHAIVLHFAVVEFGPVFDPPALTVLVCVGSAVAGLAYAKVWNGLMRWSRATL